MGRPQSGERTYLVLQRYGAQSKFDIVAIAAELGTLRTGAVAARILFDWSQLCAWQYAAPSSASILEWHKTAPPIARAAFVHDPKWNRHAAILSALLRVSNAEARSFHRSDIDRAIEWLESASENGDLR